MFSYRFGRLLQVLALIDCAFALFFGNLLSGMEAQLQILLLAGALFAVGRYLQGRGERSMRAAASSDSPAGSGLESESSSESKSGSGSGLGDEGGR